MKQRRILKTRSTRFIVRACNGEIVVQKKTNTERGRGCITEEQCVIAKGILHLCLAYYSSFVFVWLADDYYSLKGPYFRRRSPTYVCWSFQTPAVLQTVPHSCKEDFNIIEIVYLYSEPAWVK